MKKVVIIVLAIIAILLIGGTDLLGPLLTFGVIIFIVYKVRKPKKTLLTVKQDMAINTDSNQDGIILKCAKCGGNLAITHKFCTNCGAPFDGNNVQVVLDENNNLVNVEKEVFLTSKDFDPIFQLPEDKLIETYIDKELVKAQIDKNVKLIPSDILKRKRIFNIIFSVLVFIYIGLIFFHFPIQTYIIGLVLLIIFFKLTRSYDLMKYLKKQLKARPSEKISNIVMSLKTTLVKDNSSKILIVGMIVAVILPLMIFSKPVILYEKMDGGYGVRYYIFGLTNFTSATIPETHNNEKVISLRGNTFSNMYFLKKVSLPNTILEIRGQAFKNDISLTEVNIPSNLEYLGGGAFYNCINITSIALPDTVTYIGGEAFYNAISLQSINLPTTITEIRGSTFENCSSLKKITIPDSVTRIGGHAFYGCSSLNQVTFTENSKLSEIGSSAFRKCDNLYNITLPSDVYVNQRAFKESPTDIKEFWEINYDSLIDTSKYLYDGYIYIHANDTEEINQYRSTAKLQDAYLSLEKVTTNNESNEFTLKYKDQNEEMTFTLTKNEPYKIINDNIAIRIAADYVFDYSNRVSLYTYYN